jgi:hypothetical protein
MAQATASPMPVLPPVASITVAPACSRPERSASSSRAFASRSLTLPPGLRISSFAKMRLGSPEPMRGRSTSGVRPTVAMASPKITGFLTQRTSA